MTDDRRAETIRRMYDVCMAFAEKQELTYHQLADSLQTVRDSVVFAMLKNDAFEDVVVVDKTIRN